MLRSSPSPPFHFFFVATARNKAHRLILNLCHLLHRPLRRRVPFANFNDCCPRYPVSFVSRLPCLRFYTVSFPTPWAPAPLMQLCLTPPPFFPSPSTQKSRESASIVNLCLCFTAVFFLYGLGSTAHQKFTFCCFRLM